MCINKKVWFSVKSLQVASKIKILGLAILLSGGTSMKNLDIALSSFVDLPLYGTKVHI